MKKVKRLGVWMDHSTAHLMDYKEEEITSRDIKSEFTFEEKQHSFFKNENLMHNKERQQVFSYYKKIGDVIKDYDEVVLFGPTEAKIELLNVLHADHHFGRIKIDVEQTDKMTENQMHSFVRRHFLKEPANAGHGRYNEKSY